MTRHYKIAVDPADRSRAIAAAGVALLEQSDVSGEVVAFLGHGMIGTLT